MCKVVDSCIRRDAVRDIAFRPIGGKADIPFHGVNGIIVSNRRNDYGVIVIVQEDPNKYALGPRFTSLWYGFRGPCGIIYQGRDRECDEMVKEAQAAQEVFFSGNARHYQASA